MSGALTPILTYFALLGLLLASAVTTFEGISSTIGFQYSRVTHALAGRPDSFPEAPRRTDTDTRLSLLLPAADRDADLPAYEEEDPLQVPGLQEGLDRLGRHLSRMEQLGRHIRDRLSGTP